ncbi:MAG TPA: UvrD-helicase domain-containing protein, partial [Candidatus Cloacimonadota bacterium]|nr:UvrD-helicase domain-containing protein [Candidatus Cloacimonadota bacterium]
MPDISHILRADLTGEQANAALDPCREVLCVACAGSGKSRTLAYRIAFLVAGGVLPERIVAITFTEKAAESIKRKVADVLVKTGQSANLLGKMFIGTIHGFCQNILGDSDARYRQFDVLDDNKFKLFLMSRYASLGLHVLRTQMGFQYFQTLEEVQKAWNIASDEGVSLAAITTRVPILGGILEAIKRILLQDQFLDFSSMIRLVADGSRQPGRIQTRLAQVQ